jgi:PHD/YefM family antitoxin component YafN of YafNO toxin-antitoxin module
MEFHTVREFRDKATSILRSTEPVFITRRGKLAGVYMPVADGELPLDLKRQLFGVLAEQIRQEREEKGISETEILDDFTTWQKERRAARGRR